MTEPAMTRDEVLRDEWRPVVGFEGFYEVSNTGRVKRLVTRVPMKLPNGQWTTRTIPEKEKKAQVDRAGYHYVSLCSQGKLRRCLVHRLVIEAFIGPAPSGLEVRHLNGVKSDNRLGNLQYGTRSENALDRIAHGTQTLGDTHYKAKLSSEAVKEIRTSTEPSRRLAEKFGVDDTAIYKVRKGITWKSVRVA